MDRICGEKQIYMEIDKGLLVRIAFPNAERIRLLSPGKMNGLWCFVSDYKLPHRGAYKFGVSEAYGLYSSGVNFEIVKDKFDIVYASVSQFCNSSANNDLEGSRQWGITLDAIAMSDDENIILENAVYFQDALHQYGHECLNDPQGSFERAVGRTTYHALVVLEYLGHHDLIDRAYELYGRPIKLYRPMYKKARPVMDRIFERWKKLNSA